MTEAPAPLSSLPTVLEGRRELDGAVDGLRALAEDALPSGDLRRVLRGDWLGHPVHPLLTDLAIGFWTSAFVLDLVPLRRWRAASDVFVALGLLSALPTAATGLADWSERSREAQRIGVVHAGSNAVATGLYAWSLAARLRGRRARGITLGMLGAGAATVGGYLGGHLAFPPADPVPARSDGGQTGA
ncbi:MAG TPA: DUF2231 domain-containing protein [Acidimicrobiales bacterium]